MYGYQKTWFPVIHHLKYVNMPSANLIKSQTNGQILTYSRKLVINITVR